MENSTESRGQEDEHRGGENSNLPQVENARNASEEGSKGLYVIFQQSPFLI